MEISPPGTGRTGTGWVHLLNPDASRPVPVPHCTPELLNQVIAVAGPEPVGWALQVGGTAAERIFEAIPYFGSTPELRDLLYAATESITLGALALLVGPDDRRPPPLTEEARRAVRHYAEQDVPVERILRGIRFGHAEMAAAFLAACESLTAGGDSRSATAGAVSARLFEHVDRYGEEAAEHYRTVHDAWGASSAAITRRAVQGVLAGDGPPPATELPYDLDQTHRAVVITRTSPTGAGLQQAAFDVLRRMGAAAHLVVPMSGTTAWAWAGSRRSPGSVTPAPTGPAGFRVAVGPEAVDVTGFRESHTDAVAVHRLLELRERTSDVLVYDDIELAVLLARDLPAARRFVRRVLGPLAEATQRNLDILGTLQSYLDLGGSPSAAAERQCLARNTVSARIQRASTILRREIGVGSADLHACLTLVEVLGECVLVTERG